MLLKEIYVLHEILEPLKKKELPFSLSYKVMKLSKWTEDEFNFYLSKMREIIDKYGARDEEGQVIEKDGNIQLIPGKTQVVNQEIQSLDNIEIVLPKISFSLQELEGLSFQPESLQALDPFIKED